MTTPRWTLLSAQEAMGYLGCSEYMLERLITGRHIICFRTPGGHRRIPLESINDYLARTANVPVEILKALEETLE